MPVHTDERRSWQWSGWRGLRARRLGQAAVPQRCHPAITLQTPRALGQVFLMGSPPLAGQPASGRALHVWLSSPLLAGQPATG
eukprot:3980398-Karenia_brevis.AAC.1